MYKLEDDDYGIRVSNEEGEAASRRIKFTWSRVMHYDYEMEGTHFSEVTSGILYRLFLGYDDQSMDTLASLCQLEVAEQSEKA